MAEPHSPWSLRRWLRVVGAICVLAALTAIVVGALSIARLASARVYLADQVDPARFDVQALTAAMVDQESGGRGFAATGDRDFLAPYDQGGHRADVAVADLRRLGAFDPTLTAGLDTTLAAIRAWRTSYAEPTIAAVQASGPDAPRADAAAGKARFDALRSALDQQQAGLDAARAQARAKLDATALHLLVACSAIGVGLVALLVALGIWLRQVITHPIERIGSQVRVVATGQFRRTVTGEGPRELVDLGTDIDSMRRQIVAELTKVQALNHQLDLRTSELQRSNSDLEQFAYVASHDLQEPLRKVSSFCDLLAKRYAGRLDERADQYIHFAVDGARRMSVLINDLLAFSRVGPSATTGLDPVDCEKVLAGVLRDLEETITGTDARVTHDPLPTVVAEPALLGTVFQNLIGNAIKFRSEAPPRIHVGVHRDGDDWTFRVSDNGIGIDSAYAERIFAIFQRLHGRDGYPGTGIGLALCRRILDHHRGRIWLDQDTPSGAAFCFTLPAVLAPDSGAPENGTEGSTMDETPNEPAPGAGSAPSPATSAVGDG